MKNQIFAVYIIGPYISRKIMNIGSFKMKKIFGFSIIAIYLFLLNPLFAHAGEDSERISLQDAIEIALSNNQDIARMREKINEVNGLKKEAMADAFPQVNLTMDALRYRDPGILNSPNFQSFFENPPEEDPQADPQSPFSFTVEDLFPIPINLYNFSISVDQPIFVWGKSVKTIEAAKIELETTNFNIKTKENEISYNVAVAYYDYVLSYERLKVLEKAKETQEKNLGIVSDKFDIGTATKLDLLKAKASLSNLIPQAISAENEIKIARANLNYLMGRKIDMPFLPFDSLEPPDTMPELDFQNLSSMASSNRPDLASIDSGNRFLEKRIELEKVEVRPRLDFFGNYGWSAIDYDNIGNKDFESWRVGVGLSFTLFDGFRTTGKIMQVRSQIMQNNLSRQYLESEIMLEIEKSLKELNRAYESLKAANVAKEQANEALKVAQDNFELNAATQLEVLDSEREVRQAELNVAQAKRDCLVSLATLKYLSGINVLKDFESE